MTHLLVWHLGYCVAFECGVRSLLGLFAHSMADEWQPRVYGYAAFVLSIMLVNSTPV